MTDLSIEIRPTQDVELKAACTDAQRGPGQARPVSANWAGLVFQFSDQTLLGQEETLLGPYCSGCRKALLQVSFTEWTTADQIEAELPPRCPHCQDEIGTGASLAELRRQALQALKQRLAAVRRSEGDHRTQ